MRRIVRVSALIVIPLLPLVGCSGAPDEEAGGAEVRAAATGEAAEAAGERMAAEQMAGERVSAPFPGEVAGWSLRLDSPDRDASAFRRRVEGGALRVETGPRGTLYRASDAVAEGPYRAEATFVEYEAPPGHREAYGLIFGGADLGGADQRYSYFLVRADGRYLIKRRAGDGTSTVVDWTAHDAVNAQIAGDEAHETGLENRLSVTVRGGTATFRVNGTVVEEVPAADLDAHGIAGIRINHRLDVGVEGFEVVRLTEGDGG